MKFERKATDLRLTAPGASPIMSRKLIGLVVLAAVLISMSVSGLPAIAQAGIIWNSEFFNNVVLVGPAAVTRQDTAIAFDWGGGSPAPGVSADNFSARFTTDPFFSAGTYRFWVLADDKIRIYVDYNPFPLINTFDSNQVGNIISADILLTQGVHHIQADFAELSGNSYAFITWANLATNPTGPNFPPLTSSIPPAPSGSWTAEYYANPTLFGSPSLIQSEASPTHDWGAGSPSANIPADNFSARWTLIQKLPAGPYQLRVLADDGVRVIIDGVTYINEFHSATGQTYVTNVNLTTAGTHAFVVEYYEAVGVAFLNYNFTALGGGGGFVTPTPTSAISGASAKVTGAFRLNVRSAPDAVSGAILTKISRNETYPIVGKNAAGTWWQLNVNGIIGWVNARFITASNTSGVPISSGGVVVATVTPAAINCSTAPVPRLTNGRYGRVTPGLPNNIRSLPGSSGALLGQIPPGGVFAVLSAPTCASGFYWYQVNYNGLLGWTPEGGSGQYWVEPV